MRKNGGSSSIQTESTHRNNNNHMHYSQRLSREENVERRKKWLADKMCFACAEKNNYFQDDQNMHFSVVGFYVR